MNVDLAAAYSATGQAWQVGAGPVYDRLADVVVGHCPVPLTGARVLDVGAGTGAAWRAARHRGGDVVAVDVAVGMLVAAARRPPSVAGDAVALPFRSGAFNAVVAAFSLNHLPHPVAGLREAVRVLAAGGGLVVSAYAADDHHHPVKAATDAAAAERGWRPEPWYLALREHMVPRLATAERAGQVAAEAGLEGADLRTVRVSFPELGPRELVAWRLGMAQMAPFVARLPRSERAALVRDALGRLGPESPVLVRSLVVLRWRDGSPPDREARDVQPSTRDANARTASPSGAAAATATALRSASARQVA